MTTRISKIARLPRDIREQLNRRLRDGQPGKHLVDWLNSLPEVAAALHGDFDGRTITPQNVSAWRGAGYRDWVVQQETVEQTQRLFADAKEVGDAATTPLTDQLALWLAARYTVAARALAAAGGDSASDRAALSKLCRDVVGLRRGDQGAQRLRLGRERLDMELAASRKDWEAEFWEWAKRPEVREKICRGSVLDDEETLQQVRLKLFGSAALPQDIPEGQFCTPPPPGGQPLAGSNGQPRPLKPAKG